MDLTNNIIMPTRIVVTWELESVHVIFSFLVVGNMGKNGHEKNQMNKRGQTEAVLQRSLQCSSHAMSCGQTLD